MSSSKVTASTSSAAAIAGSATSGAAAAQASVSMDANPTTVDCSRADTGVWLVKVPKYLARKWTEAPDNSEVGVIRITQSKYKKNRQS
jgi:hypothetical protein